MEKNLQIHKVLMDIKVIVKYIYNQKVLMNNNYNKEKFLMKKVKLLNRTTQKLKKKTTGIRKMDF